MGNPEEIIVESYVAPSGSLRIALVTETFAPEVNGVAVTVARMVEGLLKRGNRIHMIRPRQGRNDVCGEQINYRETLVAGMAIPGYSALRIGFPAKGLLVRMWSSTRIPPRSPRTR